MPTMGYGEDGLTYWALHCRLDQILSQLADDSPVESCRLYFRPSFGRAGGPTKPQFGEFDAIVASNRFLYLVESKWDGMQPKRTGVTLEEVQRVRHEIFTWLYGQWIEVFSSSHRAMWAEFARQRSDAFRAAFGGRPLAPDNSLLARNLAHILTDLSETPRTVRNLLLYFSHQPSSPLPKIRSVAGQPITSPHFELVKVNYTPVSKAGYFSLIG